jgi:lipopolysaccharide transport system permease protein
MPFFIMFYRAIEMEPSMTSSQGHGPFAPFACVWQHRQLLHRLIERDVTVRFKGSILGKLWFILLPLAMLTFYTIIFGVIIQPRWQESVQSSWEVALRYFAGLTVFNFYIECINRAPTLMQEHVTYIKKILFPVELLAWTVLGGAFFRFIVSCGPLLVFYVALHGVPPASAVAVPLLILPLALFAVGSVWFLSAIGIFLRDTNHVVTAVTPIIMFISPIFYPMAAVPERLQMFYYTNPLTFALEDVRAALFTGSVHISLGFIVYCLSGWVFAWLGYLFFVRLRPAFADVV